MLVSGLKLPREAVDLLERQGFRELYPPQEAAVKAGLLGGRSMLVSAPTASGKTLVAVLSMMAHLSARRPGKIAYLSPLKALAAEKSAEFRRIGGVRLGGKRARVRVATGETGAAPRLDDADIVVLTNERMDALMRQGHEWTSEIGLVVADEVHLVGDPVRGPALEMILTRARLSESRPQIVGLSATMTNAAEIAKWLGARLVDSDWRPVALREGVHRGAAITMSDGERRPLRPSSMGAAVDIGLEAVRDGGQSLVFAETRAQSVALAEKAADAVSKTLGGDDKAALAEAARRILGSAEGSPLAKTLAGLVRRGAAFHHAGLAQPVRTEVEDAFRDRRIRLLSSTPTLAAGVNLPARRVVVSSILRYDPALGRKAPISVMEYKQLCGRAGRPQYDEYGEAVVVSPRSYPKDEVMRRYVRGRPQPVRSKMAAQGALKAHVLGLVAASPGVKRPGVAAFFARTLAGLQGDRRGLSKRVGAAIESLERSGLLEAGRRGLSATDLGAASSRMYLDPDSAVLFRAVIEAAPRADASSEAGRRRKPRPSHGDRLSPNAEAPGRRTLGLLHAIASCSVFFPKVYMRPEDGAYASRLFRSRETEMIEAPGMPDRHHTAPRQPWQYYATPTPYGCNRSLLALDMWVGEAAEAAIGRRLGVEPGDMHRIAESAEWLAYCMGRLAADLGRRDLARELAALRTRIRYGVPDELLGLVSVRDVGRARARRLYRSGIRDRAALASASARRIAGIDGIGPALAKKIKSRA